MDIVVNGISALVWQLHVHIESRVDEPRAVVWVWVCVAVETGAMEHVANAVAKEWLLWM